MAEPMSDERYKYLNDFIRNVNDCLASTDANANHCGVELTTAHWSHCGVELLDEINRLRAENKSLRMRLELEGLTGTSSDRSR